MSVRRCETCQWWVEAEDKDSGWGICRRKAPEAYFSTRFAVTWPSTRAEEWCGEWDVVSSAMQAERDARRNAKEAPTEAEARREFNFENDNRYIELESDPDPAPDPDYQDINRTWPAGDRQLECRIDAETEPGKARRDHDGRSAADNGRGESERCKCGYELTDHYRDQEGRHCPSVEVEYQEERGDE